MKIRWLFILMILGLCYQTSLAKPEIVKLSTTEFGSKSHPERALYIKCAMGNLNQPYKIIMIDWNRAQERTKVGEFDGFYMGAQNDKRDHYAVFSEPFVYLKLLYVVTKKSGILPGDGDFYSRRFSTDRGSGRATWLLDQYSKGIIKKKITILDDIKFAIKMLVNNRVDVAAMNNKEWDQMIKELNLNIDDFNSFVFREIPTAIYFGKKFIAKNLGFLEKFNASMKKCKAKL